MRPFLEEMADMPIPLYGYDAPPTLADRPHAREHQHMTYLQYLARKQPDPAQYPNYPDVDIRDGVSHYLIEIECPGVKNAADIHCQWTSRRHLTVTGTVGRPEYVSVMSEDNDPIALMPKLCREKDIPAQQQENGKAKERPVYLILGERRIGSFRRNFTFPVDVEQEQMSAKLEAGLLRIVLPKKQHHVPQGTGKINIEVVE